MSDTQQTGQPEQPQAIPVRKQRKSRQDALTQTAVIARYALKESKSKIAKDLGLARNTVSTILSAPEIEQHVLAGRSRAISMIPRALDAVEYRITEKRDGNVALGILRGTQVLVNQQIGQSTTNNFAVMIAQLKQARSEPEHDVINTSIVTTDNA